MQLNAGPHAVTLDRSYVTRPSPRRINARDTSDSEWDKYKIDMRWFAWIISDIYVINFHSFLGTSNSCRIFRLRGTANGGPIFLGRNEILLLGKALKFVVIFQKYALKLTKIEKLLRKFEKNSKIFGIFFNFLAGHNFLIMRKIRNII